MTRKERKQARRKKRKAAPDVLISKVAWRIARTLLIERDPGENRIHFCGTCRMPYCMGFDGKEVFCRECHYLPGCLKRGDITIKRTCGSCFRISSATVA